MSNEQGRARVLGSHWLIDIGPKSRSIPQALEAHFEEQSDKVPYRKRYPIARGGYTVWTIRLIILGAAWSIIAWPVKVHEGS